MPRVYPCKLLLVCPRLVARPGRGFFRVGQPDADRRRLERSLEASGQLL